MASTRKTPRTSNLVAVAAFGIASLGAVSLAGAHPSTPNPNGKPGHYHAADDIDDNIDYDLDDDGILEHVEIDYRHYDGDRDGSLGTGERTAYWKHMFDMGKFGSDLTPSDKFRLARIALLFDRDGDGRLTQSERSAISRLIRARKLFTRLDRNDDNNISRREARLATWRRNYDGDGSDNWLYNVNVFHSDRFTRPERIRNNWIASRFAALDRNDNSRVSWNEVESHILLTFRRDFRR